MKLAIMQPYLFPYIGYFQLINEVDKFVIYDDVNYIKQGWINRNYILVNGTKHLFTLEVRGASSFIPINKVMVGKNKDKLLKTIQASYARAPYFKDFFEIVEGVLQNQESNLALFITYSLKAICDYLDIKTEFLISSEVSKNNTLTGQQKVIDIVKNLSASDYVNSIGGFDLYSKLDFKNQDINLHFIKPKEVEYKQSVTQTHFIPNLSIIDVLMFNSKQEAKNILNRYELI